MLAYFFPQITGKKMLFLYIPTAEAFLYGGVFMSLFTHPRFYKREQFFNDKMVTFRAHNNQI